jgi:hypothetical protein
MGFLRAFLLMVVSAVPMFLGSGRAAVVETTPVHPHEPTITHPAALPKRAGDPTDDPNFIGYYISTANGGSQFGKSNCSSLSLQITH